MHKLSTTSALLLTWAFICSACASGADSAPFPTADTEPTSAEAPVATTSVGTEETTSSAARSTAATWTTEPAAQAQIETIDVQLASGVASIAVIDNGPNPSLPEGAIERRIEFRGEEIFAIEIPGDGPPILLGHGFPDSLHLYDELFPLLEGRHVVAFDFVGWGRSSKPMPGIEYEFSTRTQVDELDAVIEAYGLTDMTLVVHDLSAPVGLEYLIRSQERVAELVFLNGLWGPSPFLTPPKGIELHADPSLQAAELAVEGNAAATEAYFRFQMGEFLVPSEIKADTIDRLWDLFGEARPAFMAMNDKLYAEVAERGSRVDEIRSLTVPVDIVFGGLDPYLSADLAVEFDQIFANSTLTIVEDAGHYVQIDAPEIVASAILSR